MFRRALVFCVSVCAFAQESPTFRAGSRLVEVDVVVRNKNGPVSALKKEDFTLQDDGKRREIAVFSVTAARNSPGVTTRTATGRSNRRGEEPATATILLIDRLNTPLANQSYANQKIVQFLQTHGNKDRLGIYSLGSSLRVIQDLTDDADRLERAAKSLKPQDGRRITSDVQVDSTGDAASDEMVARSLEELQDFVVQDRSRATRDALIAIARHLAVPGRKNLIWVSGSFPIFIVREHKTVDLSRDVDEAARALSDANVAVYPVDARGLSGSTMATAEQAGKPTGSCLKTGDPCILPSEAQGGPSGIDTMNTLAALTGGRAYYNTNGIEESIQRATEDAELTYTLGFYPPEGSFDEKFHKLAVKVAGKGLDVRFRQGYFATKTAAVSQTTPATLGQLLQDPLDAVAVGITVDATRDASQPGQYQVRVLVNLRDIHVELANARWTGNVDVSLFIEGSTTARTITRKIDIPEAELAAALEKGIEIIDMVKADGLAELRVVAQDRSTGAAGSVRIPLRGK